MDKIKELAIQSAKILNNKNGIDIKLLDLKGKLPYTDYLILATGVSNRHVLALSKYIKDKLSKEKVKLKQTEGNKESGWIIVDYFDFIIHIFDKEKREFYNLDKIYTDAKKIDIDF